MAEFSVAYAPLKAFEAGWCHVPGDSGGETYNGIARNYFPQWEGWPRVDAEKAHPAFKQGAAAFSRHLAAIPALQTMVAAWFRHEWWDRMRLAEYPQMVADELFEQAVNLGRGGSGKLVQTICNALNWKRGNNGEDLRLFPDLTVDGALGPKSLDAIALVLRHRASAEDFTHACNCMQGWHYMQLAAKSLSRRKFALGWMKRTYES